MFEPNTELIWATSGRLSLTRRSFGVDWKEARASSISVGTTICILACPILAPQHKHGRNSVYMLRNLHLPSANPLAKLRLSPDKSPNRTLRSSTHMDGKRVNQELRITSWLPLIRSQSSASSKWSFQLPTSGLLDSEGGLHLSEAASTISCSSAAEPCTRAMVRME